MGNFVGGIWGNQMLGDFQQFNDSLGAAMAQFKVADGIFCSDNLFAWARNLSFLDDEKFMHAFAAHAASDLENGIIWRTHIYIWCVEQALRRSGDLVECGCYKGTSVRIACDYVDFQALRKKFYLYDLFEHDGAMPHHAMPEHGPELYAQVCERFRELPNVKVVRGRIPEIFGQVCPKKIAFLHLDLNHVDAELGALEALFDRVVPGGLILLDDYGWLPYRMQKLAEDKFFAARGLRPVELPTGQGLVLA